MAREFEIRREVELPATPEQVWEAITERTGAWLWPMEYEPWVGGTAAFGGTVTAWDPPRHLGGREEGEDGWFNQLDQYIEARPGGALLRYVHHGIFVDDWDNQYDGADQHTDFYLHTLAQYLAHFPGRRPTYVAADGPEASARPGSFALLTRRLGLAVDAAQGDAVHLEPAGLDLLDGVVDYLTPHFLGVRTADGLYRVFGRDAWGAPVSVALHLFGDHVDSEKVQQNWQEWIVEAFAPTSGMDAS